MVLAHTRGLLKPDYPFGIRSWIRENTLLNCLEYELQGQGFMARSALEAAVLPVTKVEALARTFSRSVSYLQQGLAMLQYTPYNRILGLRQDANGEKEIEKTMTLFKVLKKTDFYDRMARTLREHIKR